jgi:DNA-binding NarL/FixJ family response regulator
MKKLTIVIVDDHQLVRETWSYILNTDPRFRVIAACSSGEDAVKKIPQLKPDLVIMDINLPGISGIEATEQLCAGGCESRILGVSLYSDANYAHRMIQKGAMGYVTKNSSREEMFKALVEINEGNYYVCNEVSGPLADLIAASACRERITA